MEALGFMLQVSNLLLDLQESLRGQGEGRGNEDMSNMKNRNLMFGRVVVQIRPLL